MGTTTKSRSTQKKSLGMTPNQQWLALALLAMLGVLAVFWFGIFTTDGTGGGGHSGYLVPFLILGAGRRVSIPQH